MQRWFQFGNITSTTYYGYGTVEQASRYLDSRNDHLAANHYVMTALNEGEEPFANSVVIDLDSGDRMPATG